MIGDKDLGITTRMLDFYALRHKVIAHNIANADTKDFHKLNADFGRDLADAVKSGDVEAAEGATFKVTASEQVGVDSEGEVASMTKNSMLFDTFSQIAQYKLRMLRTAIGK